MGYGSGMDYVDVEEGRRADGLRLVLTAGGPGPWSEAAKAVFHVKRLAWTPVRQNAGEANEDLARWTGQTSAPVAVWMDEPPCTTTRSILWLAERLAPTPALLPDDGMLRALCLGLCDELHAENGLGWCRRLMLLAPMMQALGADAASTPIGSMALRYGFSEEAAARAENRVVQILELFSQQLASQAAVGRRYLVGEALTAVDLYWATFAAICAPLPPDLCPMPEGLRDLYTVSEGPVADALSPALLEHRDFVYREHLRLPLDF